ncbi:Pimeloyl-ACP methyl ester carboxylesterase [Corynebacterium mycetoides]|uniref:Pimeloyl-ACP methyl ester carboxylesterase n=1 Tax=Corynebacterium mycetoides TaxID=38302 RepID=A0A1G9Q5A9_9CORY|nr:alpha/beta hydrolase [Corynebacterium mycetoides]SDM06234.1 Pimeloyl-ACP methyl ester carboxylesterase [Corynebacterium mycetoides]
MPALSRRLPPTVVELEGDFEHELLHTRGTRLHAVTAGEPAHPLVLLLHGTFGGWFDYRDVIAPLAERGFHVAALDMRGYGMSDKPPPRPGNEMLIAVGDVKGAISTLGHKSAIVVGADTGGGVAWVTAALHPELVSGLVSVSAAHPADLRAAMAARPWDFMPLLGRITVARLPSRLLRRFPRTRRRVYRDNLVINTTSQFHGTARFDEVLNVRRTAADIDNAFVHSVHNSRLITPPLVSLSGSAANDAPVAAPTLLIHPGQSLWKPVVARQKARVTGTVRQLSVPGAKNLPHIENPAEFTAAVAQFAALTGGTGGTGAGS